MSSASAPAAQFEFDLARHTAAADIYPDHAQDFNRLCLVLSAGPKSQFLFVEYRSQLYRERLIHKLNEAMRAAGLRAANFDFAPCATFIEAEQGLHALAASADAIHLIGGDKWFTEGRWREFNLRRETIARDLARRLVFWINPEQVPQLVDGAPDVWAWRGGVYDLVEPDRTVSAPGAPAWAPVIDNRSLGERSRRMAALREQLKADDIPDAGRAMLLDELAGLLFRLGELDEALRIRRDEELPVYEKLGDVRERAVAQAKLGQCLLQKGETAQARALWNSAVADLSRMRLPEAKTVQGWLTDLDRSLEKKE